jgi:hypothetical protein
MTNDLTPREPEADDGFSGSLSSGLFRSNNYLRWTDANGWSDRDGLKPPSPLLVFAIDEALQKWKDNKQEIIRDKPLPDPEQLNAAIPQSEWERGLDGNLRKPWEHVVIVCLIDPNTGKAFKHTAPTRGAHIAYDELKEAVITMRALRGSNVIPVVNLSERPFKTNFGMRKRPYYDIIGWKTPGGDGGQAVTTKPAAPQLSGPTAASVETSEAPAETPAAPPAAPSVAPSAAPPAPTSKPAQPHQAKPKPPVNPTSETLATMSDVKPVTMSEVMGDEVPW